MAKPASLRAEDWRAIVLLVGECRELGDEPTLWRRHLLDSLSRWIDAELGFCGEMAGLLAEQPADLGFTDWGFQNGFNRTVQAEVYARIERDPSIYESLNAYFSRLDRHDGACVSSRDSIDEGTWYRSKSYQLIHRPLCVDHALWCYRSISNGSGDEFSGLILERSLGRRDFSARDRTLVREAQAALTPLIGGALARFAEPSPLGLSTQVRRVLACLLEGDGDKQVARRLRLSPHTVNQHTKAIYRHFGVRSRAELLARWVRRGWPSPPAWAD